MGVCAVAFVDMRLFEFQAMTHSNDDLQLASNDQIL